MVAGELQIGEDRDKWIGIICTEVVDHCCFLNHSRPDSG